MLAQARAERRHKRSTEPHQAPVWQVSGLLLWDLRVPAACSADVQGASHSSCNGPGTVQPNPLPTSFAGQDLVLPQGYWKLATNKKSILCMTNELAEWNANIKRAADDCCVLASQILAALQVDVEKHRNHLVQALDSIALLDLLSGYVAYMHSQETVPFCRPQLSAQPGVMHPQRRLLCAAHRTHAWAASPSAPGMSVHAAESCGGCAQACCTLLMVFTPCMAARIH